MNRSILLGLLALVSWLIMACQEELPTATGDNLIPVEAVTVEVRLSFDEFAENLRVFGGYGSPAELSYGMMAHEYEGELEARTLVDFWTFPVFASVRDSTGTTRPDSSLVFVGGRLVVKMDTLASVHEGTVEMAAGVPTIPWDDESANWQMAVDAVDESVAWPEPGAGPVTPLASATWDPALADSVIFELDSAAVATWPDTASWPGLRLDVLTEGVRIQARAVRIFLTTRPSSNPDTLVDLMVESRYHTFVYEPVLAAPEAEFRVGGVPAWRSVFDMKFPTVLNGPAELCQKVECPLVLEPEMVNSASLFLTTASPPPGFRPSDSLRVDVRTVLEPDRLPKSPLGASVAGYFGFAFAPEYFGDEAGTKVEVPFGGYVTDLIRGETVSGDMVSKTVVLLAPLEPSSLTFGSFYGPGGPNEPVIRLILTSGGGVEIR